MNAKQQYDKFVEHVQQSTKKFTLKRSSLKPLFAILDEQMKKKKVAALDPTAVTKALGKDKRLAKYQSAIDTLLGVWGTDHDYVIPKPGTQPKESAITPTMILGDGEDKRKILSTKDMACHTWAISGTPANAAKVNTAYTELMDEIGERYDYGFGLDKGALANARQATMDAIGKSLCEKRTEALDHQVYVCGGFREGQVCPEHLWIEDHTAGKSYDTFIAQDVRVVDRVGEKGKPFKPGCEASAFKADEIARVRVDGYTKGQYTSLP